MLAPLMVLVWNPLPGVGISFIYHSPNETTFSKSFISMTLWIPLDKHHILHNSPDHLTLPKKHRLDPEPKGGSNDWNHNKIAVTRVLVYICIGHLAWKHMHNYMSYHQSGNFVLNCVMFMSRSADSSTLEHKHDTS